MQKENINPQDAINSAAGLRKSSDYKNTQEILETQGVTFDALNQTPPVGLNLVLLSQMAVIPELKQSLSQRPLNTSILGIAIAEGVPDFKKFLTTSLETDWQTLSVFDLDHSILEEVDQIAQQSGLENVLTFQQDVRHTGLETNSLDLSLRDHVDNCCPPNISRAIQPEVERITRPGGISIVNVTTSESLDQSNREIITHDKLLQSLSPEIIQALQNEVFSIEELKQRFGNHLEDLRGKLLEIEPNGSFAIFGENEVGHGEWFRTFETHQQSWQETGFEVIGMKLRVGEDSHLPPLQCIRHNIVLRKK